ncbi:dedicator of cytokinesis protein 9 isoform X4 [Arapaima gigas]
MSHAAPPETRRFTRCLSKPGTAAELRQSVSEVVRSSVLLVDPTISQARTVLHAPTQAQKIIVEDHTISGGTIGPSPAETCV